MLLPCGAATVAHPGATGCGNPRIGKSVVATILLTALCGCAGSQIRLATDKFAFNFPVKCEDDAGLTTESPVAARGRFAELLGSELITCPGGAIATPGEVGKETTSISCPGKPIQIFFKVGDISPDCVPEPLGIVDRRAAAMTATAVSLIKSGRVAEARKISQKALDMQPDSEFLLSALASAQMAGRDFAGARNTLSRALKANPDSPAIRLAHAVAASELGDKNTYAAEVADLFDDLPDGHQMRPDLLCRLADNQNRLGNRALAITMARDACRDGASMCCGLAASDPEPVEVVPPENPGTMQGKTNQGSM